MLRLACRPVGYVGLSGPCPRDAVSRQCLGIVVTEENSLYYYLLFEAF